MPCRCYRSLTLPRGAIGCFIVCDCGISWPYSLTFFPVQQNKEHTQKQTHKTKGVTFNNEKKNSK